MAELRLIPVDRAEEWCEALSRCGGGDSYHLPGYHLVARAQGEGEPYLLHFEHLGVHACWPFLLREIDGLAGLGRCGLRDAVSAYGYPGLLCSVDGHSPGAEEFRSHFQAAFTRAMRELQVVALFVRQNPLIDTSWLLSSMAEVTPHGSTVAVDLRQPEEEQLRQIRQNHRRDVRRARREGVTVGEDADFRRIDVFRRLYDATMDRVGAADGYYFSAEYYAAMQRHFGRNVKLLLAEKDGRVTNVAMFLLGERIMQYHLNGTAAECPDARGGAKLLIDEARRWGTENGYHWLHLGGGLGARDDSLFGFKAGFSKKRLSFQTIRMVIEPAVYRELSDRRGRWALSTAGCPLDEDFFPKYRATPVRRAA